MNDLTILEKKGWLMLLVQRKFVKGLCKHQRMAGSNLGDDHKTLCWSRRKKNTSNQFESKKMLQNEN
jgi:hypothetical protein